MTRLELSERALEYARIAGLWLKAALSRSALLVALLIVTFVGGMGMGAAGMLLYGKPIGEAIIETGMKVRMTGVTHVTRIETGVAETQDFVNPEPSEQMQEIVAKAGRKK